MNPNVILEYFDKLTDETAMFIEFRNRAQLLVDNNDTIRVSGDLIEIKSSSIGTYITSFDEVIGIKICNRLDIMNKVLLSDVIGQMGENDG